MKRSTPTHSNDPEGPVPLPLHRVKAVSVPYAYSLNFQAEVRHQIDKVEHPLQVVRYASPCAATAGPTLDCRFDGIHRTLDEGLPRLSGRQRDCRQRQLDEGGWRGPAGREFAQFRRRIAGKKRRFGLGGEQTFLYGQDNRHGTPLRLLGNHGKMTVNLDLRTLVAVERGGSFARAAERVGRSESAVSLQLKRVEEQIGQPLFHRAGRNMVLTEAGERMLAYAERLIALNDEAVGATVRPRLDGIVRLGVPADFAETWLPTALARFARLCPSVKVETTIERSPALAARLGRGGLDLAMAFAAGSPDQARWSGTIPMAWIGPRDYRRHGEDPVRLAVFDPPCLFRAAWTGSPTPGGYIVGTSLNSVMCGSATARSGER
jgi:DNA-binding transcriptional LysR family regulator